MAREFANDDTIAGTDVELDAYMDDPQPNPINPYSALTDLSGGWLPKTDWGRDRIIASDD